MGILKPSRNEDNEYRVYSHEDIDRILMIDFYRGADMNLVNIKKIGTDSSIKNVENFALDQAQNIDRQIKKLEIAKRRNFEILNACDKVKKYLDNIQIVEMEIPTVIGEVEDYRSYSEYRKILESKDFDGQIIRKMKRRITFSDHGILTNKMVIIEDNGHRAKKKCVYTVVKDGENNEDPLKTTFNKCIQYCQENNIRVAGVAYIGMLILFCDEGKLETFS